MEQNLAIGQHHLLVASERGHPVQAKRLELFGRQNSQNPGHLHRGRDINLFDPRVGIRGANKIAGQHAVELDIIDIVAFALGKAGILHAFARTAHALEVGDAIFAVFYLVFHSAASFAASIWVAAA